MLRCRIANMPCKEARGESYKEKCPACKWRIEKRRKEFCEYEKCEKREDDQREFEKACNELKTELKKTWLHKMIIRLLDWLAEKI